MIGSGALLAATAASAEPRVIRSVPVAPGGVYELVFDPASNDVHIAAVGPMGGGQASLARLDGRTLAAEPGVALGAEGVFGLGLNRRTRMAYGTDTRGGAVAVIDLAAGRVVARITDNAGAHLREAIVDEGRNLVYVSAVGSPPGATPAQPNRIWVIDGAANRIARTIDVETGGLTGIALDSARNRLFGTGMMTHEVVVVDAANGRTVARWPTGSQRPTNLVYDAAGNRLFVASQASGDLTVMNAADGTVIRRVPTGAGALSVAWNPAVNQIYVTNREAGTLTVVDARTYAVLANLPTGTHPQSIAIDPATNRVYVTNKRRMRPRDAAPGTPAPEDPNGDTLTLIEP
ncbi:MAG TPA: YncE family protein [Allosphingosinicella sp.]|nr:YncE family protein [Allosphingosinicella sp.]